VENGRFPADSSQYVPDEIIVKLRETIAYDTTKPLKAKGSANGFTLSRDLDELNERYRVRKVDPLLKNTQQKRRTLKTLQTEEVDPIQAKIESETITQFKATIR